MLLQSMNPVFRVAKVLARCSRTYDGEYDLMRPNPSSCTLPESTDRATTTLRHADTPKHFVIDSDDSRLWLVHTMGATYGGWWRPRG